MTKAWVIRTRVGFILRANPRKKRATRDFAGGRGGGVRVSRAVVEATDVGVKEVALEDWVPPA